MFTAKALLPVWSLALLAGCIWISKERYVEAMGCDPERAVAPGDLWIHDSIDETAIAAGAGARLTGGTYPYLGRHVATLGDLDGDGVASWTIGGQKTLLLGQRAPETGPTGEYTITSTETDDWLEILGVEEADGAWFGAADGADLSGDDARDLLVYSTSGGTSPEGVTVYLLSSEDNEPWSEPSLPTSPLLVADDAAHAFSTIHLVAFSASEAGSSIQDDGFSGLLFAGSNEAADGASCTGDYDAGGLYFFAAGQLQSGTLGSNDWSEARSSWDDYISGTSLLGCVALARAGDMDGEGHTDALVGAPGYDAHGRALVIAGEDLSEADVLTLSALDELWSERGDVIGIAVAGAGDVDGDGYDDALIGSSGEARIYRGGNPRDAEPWVTFTPEEDVADLGREVAGGDDLDSDSLCTPDVVLGGVDGDGDLARWVFLGSTLEGGATVSTADRQAVVHPGVVPPTEGPQPLAQLADLNDDGYAEILSGAPSDDGKASQAWFLFGGPSSN